MTLTPFDLVKNSSELSSPPEILVKINEVLGNPESSFEEIGQIIQADTSLSAQLMKIVNSSLFNFPSPIDTISHAVSIIGLQPLKDLALSTCILTSFSGNSKDQADDMRSFWSHSLGCAIAARVIAIHCRESNPERFYLAGILHDIGRLILLTNYPKLAEKVMAHYEKSGKPLTEAEQDVLGFTHSDLGTALVELWNLPPFLKEAIESHHAYGEKQDTPPSLECAVLNLADMFAKAMELGSSGDPYVPPLNPRNWEVIGISTALLPLIWEQVELQYADSKNFILSN